MKTSEQNVSFNNTTNSFKNIDTYQPGVYNTHIMNSREIIKKLKDDGWVLHHTKGDHHQFKHPDKQGKVTVPHPKKDIPIGTLKNIFRQAGWNWR